MNFEEKLAKLICDYSLEINHGELVLIRGEVCAEPLIRECYKQILKKGAHPLVRISFSEQNAIFYKYGSKHQFEYIPDIDRLQAETITAQISIDATDNSKQLSLARPEDIAIQQAERGKLRDIMFKREDEGKFKWVIAPYPTPAMAQDAELPFDEYKQFVYNACKLNEENPIISWQNIRKYQENLAKKLDGGNKIRIVGDRTDISFNISGRKWISCHGSRNMPDGELFTSPVEDSANGHVYFDLPTNYLGVEAQGIYLELKDGKITKATAEKGENFLLKMLDTDEGARYIGEVSFGLNNNITKPIKNILFDEKIGKTMHIAVGSSYSEAGGKNKSGLHWDLVKTMKENSFVEYNDKRIYQNGEFLF